MPARRRRGRGGDDLHRVHWGTGQGTLRLIVHRVRPAPGSQLALDLVLDHHASLTDRGGARLEIEADQR